MSHKIQTKRNLTVLKSETVSQDADDPDQGWTAYEGSHLFLLKLKGHTLLPKCIKLKIKIQKPVVRIIFCHLCNIITGKKNPYQIDLIVTFNPGGNSWVKNSQWQLLSSPISSPGRLASGRKFRNFHYKTFYLLLTNKLEEQMQCCFSFNLHSFHVGFKPVSLCESDEKSRIEG